MSEEISRTQLMKAVSQVLSQLASDTEAMGEKLCADPDVVAKHLEQFQNVDRITQSLRELSILIVAPDAVKAIDEVRLADLQTQLCEACWPFAPF
ncbi:MAG: hypothetical protein AAGL10_13150 [Pseudomonadota bacterium]